MSADEHFVRELPPDVRETSRPLEVEFGTGKARFLIESGRLHAERDFLGLERNLAFYRVARDRIRKSGLENVRVLRADAREIAAQFPAQRVAAFHAYFLDPWPKKRQRKRRLLDAPFLSLLADKTAPGGLLRIVTDHDEYALSILSTLHELAAAGVAWEEQPWEAAAPPPQTHYEIKYAAAGRTIRRFLLRKAGFSQTLRIAGRESSDGPPTSRPRNFRK